MLLTPYIQYIVFLNNGVNLFTVRALIIMNRKIKNKNCLFLIIKDMITEQLFFIFLKNSEINNLLIFVDFMDILWLNYTVKYTNIEKLIIYMNYFQNYY